MLPVLRVKTGVLIFIVVTMFLSFGKLTEPLLASDPLIPHTDWVLSYVDSEQFTGSNDIAAKAFDGDPNTIWHTQFTPTTASYPHEIRINLGLTYSLSAFRYLPRQDGGVNGRIANYEFYVSLDGTNWGTPVAAGTFANNAAEKEVSFAPKTGQYIRLRALSEVNGNPWTSMAEINVLGVFFGGNQAPNSTIVSPPNDMTIMIGQSLNFTGTGSDPENNVPLTYSWSFGGSGTPNSTVQNPGAVVFNAVGTYTVTFAAIDAQGLADPTPATRVISVINNSPGVVVPHTGWTLKYVDSQEIGGEAHDPATNAFDGNPNTKWHTQFSPSTTPYPHEIQIDLGQMWNLSAFRYLPRQDGGVNGRIANYEFYVSQDGTNWGPPVAAGTFANSATEKEVSFASKIGKFIRLRALSEVNGNPWASMAEINILSELNLPPDSVISSPSSDMTIVAGQSASFAGTGSDPDGDVPLTYLWKFGTSGVADSTEQNPGAVVFNAAGTYTVTFTVTDALGLEDPASATRVITVRNNQAADGVISSPSSDTTIVAGQSVTFAGTGSDPDGDVPLTYLWKFGTSGVADSMVQNPGAVVFNTAGTYTVTFTVTDSLGLEDPTSATRVITVRNNQAPDGVISSPSSDTTIVAGQSVTFAGTGSDPDGDVPLSYLWTFGTSGAADSTVQNPGAVVFNTAGTYTVTFTVTDALGLADPTSATRVITVRNNQAPDSTISSPSSDMTIVAGQSVSFAGMGSDPDGDVPLSYLWTFGTSGVADSTEQNPGAIVFNTAGTYTVTFTVTDSLGLEDPTSATRVITVRNNQAPDSTISSPSSDMTIVAGQSVTFAGTGSDPDGDVPLTYLWKFGTSGVADSTVQNPGAVVFNTAGTYTVTFTVTDGLGLEDPTSATRVITVRNNQAPDGVISSPSSDMTIAAGQSVAFAGAGSDPDGDVPLTYLWKFGTSGVADSTVQNPGAVVFNTAGTYTVTFTVTDALGLADPTSATRVITVRNNQAPDSTISSPSSDMTIVAGQSVSFAGMGSDPDGDVPLSYLWTFGTSGVADSTEQNPGAIVFNTAGTYTVTFTVTDALGLADPTSATRVITVRNNQAPDGVISSPSSDMTIAAGQSVAFAGAGSDPDGDVPLSYLWTFGNSGASDSTEQNPGAIVFNTAGTYTVTFTVTDSLGLEDPTTTTRVITVRNNQAPDGVISSPSSDMTIAAGQSVAFAGAGSDPDGDVPLSYLWTFGNSGASDSTVQNPGAVVFNTAGTYTVTFTVTDALGLADPTSATRVITVRNNQAPDGVISSPSSDMTIVAGQSVSFAGMGSDPDGDVPLTYLWKFGTSGVADSTVQNPGAVVFNTAGTYTVTFTVTDGLGLEDPTSATRVITVRNNQAPDSTISNPLINVTILAGQSVTFAGAGSDPDGDVPLTYLWKFGTSGVADSTEQNPGAIVFNTAGTYTVTFTVTDGLGLEDPTSATRVITVRNNQAPDSTISNPLINVTILAGQSVTFAGAGSDPDGDVPLSYLWKFGTSGVPNSTVQNPGAIVFNTIGTYTVTFTVADSQGLADPTPATRVVTVTSSTPQVIPHTDWVLKYVDSEQFTGSNDTAVKAFDGDPNTIWHTQFTPTTAYYPHEIQINLGLTYSLSAFRYLPRQDGGVNGRIANYEFYVSQDGTNWGTPVAAGTFANNAAEKEVSFAPKTGQYIRLRALSEVNGNPWAAMAEINVLGVLFGGNLAPSSTIVSPPNDLTVMIGQSLDFGGTGSDPENNVPLAYLWNFGGSGAPNSTVQNPGAVVFNTLGTYTVTFTVIDPQGLADPTPATRVISVINNSPGVVPHTGWTLKYVDSQEIGGEEHDPATNAFDGNVNTIWHTKVLPAPPYPHEIQIDLGQVWDLNAFRYLPRQGGGVNGRIASYEFYVSSDGTDWGAPVAAGIFANSATEKEVSFASKIGKFIRLRALSEVNGNPWASMAEINVLGILSGINLPPDGTISSPSANVTIALGQSVTFAGSGSDPDTNTPFTYLWNFGGSGAANSTAQNPGEVVFNTIGAHTVTFTVTDAKGLADPTPATRVISVTDNQAPDSAISSPSTDVTIMVGQSVAFAGSGSDPDNNLPLTYLWNFGGSGVPNSTVQNPGAIVFNTAGTYTVTFTVTDAKGLADPTPATRAVTVTNNTPQVIPRTGWTLKYVDSQQTILVNNAATNAFDGNAGTIWHTQFSPTVVPYPHEIQIDLGQIWSLSAFRYLPRQDGGVNGRIANYEFYVSLDGTNWGTPVATGTFANNASEKEVSFTAKNGQFIRLRALSEVGGNPWTSLAEINVLGIASGINLPPESTISSPSTDVTIGTGQSVTFAGSGSDLDLPLAYLWNFGGSGAPNSTVQNPGAVVFNTAGAYTVTFTVTDGRGLADPTPATRVITVTNAQAPDSTISSPSTEVTVLAGQSVTFAGNGSDPDNNLPLTYLWNFGSSGAANSTAQNPGAVVFNTVGIYTVTFTVTDALGLADPTPATRVITVTSSSPLVIPHTGWTLKYADSQQTTLVDNAAVNAFDGNASTLWHTQFSPTAVPYPHEIQIDLGQIWNLSAFRYLPRQDGGVNGRIANYEFYVSQDGTNWGTAVAAGTFANSATEKEVTFTSKLGKFIRLRALSEVNGNAWTSLAEINVLGLLSGINISPESTISSPSAGAIIGTGDSVTFAGSGNDPDGNVPLEYLWSFGGSGVPNSTVQNPGAIVFNTAGTFTVTFTATDAKGLADPSPATRVITVRDNQAPDSTISSPSGNVTIGAGQSVTFAGSGSDPDSNTPLTYLWNFGGSGAANSTVQNPGAVAFNTIGTYTVTFTVTDAKGLADPTPATRMITVTDNMAPDSAISSPSSDVTIGTGQFVTFAGTGSDPDNNLPLTYLWNFGGSGAANSTVQNPGAVVFNTAGTYTVTLTVTDAKGLADPTPATRVITVLADSVVISQAGWTLKYADSEETGGEEHDPATNAFDGNVNTFWHTKVFPAPPYPHEIQINMGQMYAIDKFSYLPRQDGGVNGRISQYEFYVSEDGVYWGPPVAIGSFANNAAEKQISFTPKTGQFIRLKALSEVNGNPWASVAEINVWGFFINVSGTPNGTITSPSGDVTITTGQSVSFAGSGADSNGNVPLTYLWQFDGSGAADSTAQNPGAVVFNNAGTYKVAFTVMNSVGVADPVPATRTITVTSTSPAISHAGWTLKYFDSQEIGGEENDPATNGFDGNVNTFWHTKVFPAPPYPHEIQINLGQIYTLDGFRYLPRQDGGTNGMIANYEFYVSTDGTTWGTAVSAGTFAKSAAEKQVSFRPQTVQFIRLKALSEVNGNPWASMAEINVLGVLNQAPNGTISSPSTNVTIDPGESVTFTGSGSDPDNNLPLTYLWNFGSSGAPDSTVQNPGAIVFNTVGTYTVTFTVKDAKGIADPTPATRVITVANNQAPDSTISSPSTGVIIGTGESVAFAGSGSDLENNVPLTYLWNFGGSGLPDSTAQNPGAIVFNTAGTFTVTFTATDAKGLADASPATRVITVRDNQAPDSTISSPSGNVTIGAGQSVTFAGSGSDPDNNTPLTYLWNFGGSGAPDSTVQNPGSIVFNTVGTYTVTFTVTDAKGLADPTPATRVITVTDNMAPDSVINSPSSNVMIGVGQFVTFAGSGSDPDSNLPLMYLWNFGGSGAANSTAQNPGAVVFNTAGTYTVTLTVTDAKGLADPTSATRVITVLADSVVISHAGWTLKYADSEETGGEEHDAATNAFDGNVNTFWHTKVFPAPPYPHEIQINMGQMYAIDKFSYLPRQDGVINGRISQYEFYISEDGIYWGPPVAMGFFANNAAEKTISFTPKTGQFIRLRALSEVNGNPWASVAEINVWGFFINVSGTPNGTIDSPSGDVTITTGQSVSFGGSGSDPNGNVPLTYLWQFDGSGAADSTAQNPGAVVFNNAGTYKVAFTVMNSVGVADPVPATRTITVTSISPAISHAGWTLKYADSEETGGEENDPATNAFDGNVNTFWHTKVSPAPPYPHEIQINLGQQYTLDGFRYLPRQDGGTNGMIANYEFYASLDGTNWGTAVATGTFAKSAAEKQVSFRPKTVQFIRLKALSEVNGNPWASMAEINVLGVLNQAPNGTISSPSTNVTIEPGESVAFAGSGSDPDNNVPLTYLWNFGSSGEPNSTVQNPGLIVFNTIGTYTVTFTVKDAKGLADPTPATRVITVANNQPPDSAISSPSTGVIMGTGDSVTFAGSGSDPENNVPLTYLWNFGGSGLPDSTVQNPGAIVFNTAGTFTVTFTATDSKGLADASPATRVITVRDNQAPDSTISSPSGNVTIGAGQSVTFAGSGSDPDNNTPLTYLWNFGGSGVPDSTVQNPGSIVFNTVGTYTVTFTVTDAKGLADPTPATRVITVTDNMAPDSTITSPSGNVMIALGQFVTFAGSGSDPDNNLPLTYLWNFGGSGVPNSTVQNPGAVAFNAIGTYAVTFTVTDAKGLADPTPVTRVVTVTSDSAVISHAGWTLKYADSEETGGEEYDAATNAFDGNVNTFWHTKASPAPLYPHEIQINMGQIYAMDKFSYLPRQDGGINGRISQYEFYISEDGVYWGPPVAIGFFANNAAEKQVSFTPKTGQFIRLRALSEVNGNPWASVAEINVWGFFINVSGTPNGTINNPSNDVTITAGQSVSFAGSGTDPNGNVPLTYLWQFGGSGAADSTLQNPGAVVFNVPGTYTVTFTVTNSVGVADPVPATRVITVTGNSQVISHAGWTLKYADSQETGGLENDAATMAFDGNVNTFWHTKAYPAPPYPHEIQIDLGQPRLINAFRYLPRQDGGTNGMIANYEFYISTDGITWGTPVAAGTFAKNATEKQVPFSPTTGRYIRLRALSEVNGNNWASMAEINVLGW